MLFMLTPTDLAYLEIPPREQDRPTPPLLILLHGVGSNEQDLISLAPLLDPRFHIVSLRAPYELGPGSCAWFHVLFTPQGPRHDAREAEVSRELLIDTIPGLVAATGTDPEQVYLMGFSQGAIMSLYLGLTLPELVAGVVAMSGRVIPEAIERLATPRELAGLPALVIHGTADAVLPVDHGRATREALAGLPIDFTYREYPMGHEISPESLADIVAWLGARLDAPTDEATETEPTTE
jgi:phospholipase/carboxylesterase